MKELDNGDLLFHKSEIPLTIGGYKQSHGNPCLFRKEYKPCIHREVIQIRFPCGRLLDREQCKCQEATTYRQIINPGICERCPKITPPGN